MKGCDLTIRTEKSGAASPSSLLSVPHDQMTVVIPPERTAGIGSFPTRSRDEGAIFVPHGPASFYTSNSRIVPDMKPYTCRLE